METITKGTGIETFKDFCFDFLLKNYSKILAVDLEGFNDITQFQWTKTDVIHVPEQATYYASVKLFKIDFLVEASTSEEAFNRLYDLVERFFTFRKAIRKPIAEFSTV